MENCFDSFLADFKNTEAHTIAHKEFPHASGRAACADMTIIVDKTTGETLNGSSCYYVHGAPDFHAAASFADAVAGAKRLSETGEY